MTFDDAVQRLLDTYEITPKDLGMPQKRKPARRPTGRAGRVSTEDLDDIRRFTELVRGGVEVSSRNRKKEDMCERAAKARWG